MNSEIKRFRLFLRVLLCVAFVFTTLTTIHAGSATWNLSPSSGDWNTAANWTPQTVPNGPDDIATFAASDITSISISSSIEVSGITYAAGADLFNLTPGEDVVLSVSGAGITNQSEITQRFSTSTEDPGGELQFLNSATAGNEMLFNINVNGMAEFFDNTSADSANFINHASKSGRSDNGGRIEFFNNATAAEASFTNNGGNNPDSPAEINFNDSSTAGNATIFNKPSEQNSADDVGGFITFGGDASADHAKITNMGSMTPSAGGRVFFVVNATAGNATVHNKGGSVEFQNAATAGNATFTNEGSVSSAGGSGSVDFFFGGNGGDGTFINNGASTPDLFGGLTTFDLDSTAGNSTLIANGGVNVASGGHIFFIANSEGGTCRVELFAFGTLNLSDHDSPGLTIGSLEGDGRITLGNNMLSVGQNNRNTVFSGLIHDGISGVGGSLMKIGEGQLTLSNANTYTGGTTVDGGTLLVTSKTGSPTGTGGVAVNSGTLGGTSTLTGAITVGTGPGGAGAFLAPGVNGAGKLSSRAQMVFNSDATYVCEIDTVRTRSDQIAAKGVIIFNSAAQISLLGIGNSAIPSGTVFTIIANTRSQAISGAFANLPDGSTVTVGSNTFQANYEGGDGNDLTLTVVP